MFASTVDVDAHEHTAIGAYPDLPGRRLIFSRTLMAKDLSGNESRHRCFDCWADMGADVPAVDGSVRFELPGAERGMMEANGSGEAGPGRQVAGTSS